MSVTLPWHSLPSARDGFARSSRDSAGGSSISRVTFSGAQAGAFTVSGGPVCIERNGSVLGSLPTGQQVSISWSDYSLKSMSFPSHSKTETMFVDIAYGDSIGGVEWLANATTG